MDESKGQWAANFFRAGLIGFGFVGVVESVIILLSTTHTTVVGAFVAGVCVLSIWMLAGLVFCLGMIVFSYLGFGRNPQVVLAAGKDWLARARQDRDGAQDAGRMSWILSGMLALVVFLGTSVAFAAWLIATRNGPVIIAVAIVVFQVLMAVFLGMVAGALIRALRAILVRKDKIPGGRHLHTFHLLTGMLVVAGVVFVAIVVQQWPLVRAVEGPSFLLFGAGALAQTIIAAWTIGRPLRFPRLIPVIFVVAVLATVFGTQLPEARRLIVLHGQTARFFFHHTQRFIDVVDRAPCPAPGLMTPQDAQAYLEQCGQPRYDRPFAREEVPSFERPQIQDPDFVLITWDSVRASRLSYMGHSRQTTPHLDEFAGQSANFRRAFSQDSGTGPSFWSMMAGKTPFQVSLGRADIFPPEISEEELMLGQALQEHGYHLEAVMCGRVFDTRYWAIRRGFSRFQNVCGRQTHFLAPTVTEHALNTLNRMASQDQPFFLWVHYYDPHEPYTNHEAIGFGEQAVDRYDEELRYTDEHMLPLLERIRELSQERQLFTFFSADHGENFGEHGPSPHARNLYHNVTHVPFLVHGPAVQPRVIDAPTALNDLYPTVLDLASIAIPEESTMVSQVPVLFGAEPDQYRMVFQENSYARPRRHTKGLVYGRYHYILDLTSGTRELFDYIDDPLERRNLIGTQLVEERIMHQALLRFLTTTRVPDNLAR